MRLHLAARRRRNERGLTLVEVLVAFFILFVVTLAVLQLLSMAYLVNVGSLARTELTYKAEQVVETIRLLNFRYFWLQQAPTATELACCPVGAGAAQTITPGTCMDFWGPNGANVINDDSRFTLDYSIDANLGVTVHAVPMPHQYLGSADTKVVVYVAQLRNW
ncbi:MAG TPA: prepilin-type N-terminal cleavage/methylation domain-containing protein [Thermoanaerobaculaceae bacterium]|nr:prepilin-type N-terminal cleavage/methylation domain-containing protein [Thermoanaerobaculaceae bacterium]